MANIVRIQVVELSEPEAKDAGVEPPAYVVLVDGKRAGTPGPREVADKAAQGLVASYLAAGATVYLNGQLEASSPKISHASKGSEPPEEQHRTRIRRSP